MQSAPEAAALVSYGAIFTLFFVTLGPLKVLGPFAQLTRETDEATMRRIAVRAFVLAVIAVVVGGFAGRSLLENWGISAAAMLLAGGIIFALVGLSLVLEQYQPAHPPPPPLPAAPMAATRPAARMAQEVNSATCHIGIRCSVRPDGGREG